MTNPVTWSEVSEALGNGEARRVAEEHWKRACPPHCNPPFEESVGYCWTDLIACLLRAELWCHQRMWEVEWGPPVAGLCRRAIEIRTIRERLEREVYDE